MVGQMCRVRPLVAGLSALLLTCSSAWSEPQSWMKKPRPNDLGLTLSIHPDCPENRSRYERVVLSAFHRSWINRTQIRLNEPYLRVVIWCQRTDSRSQYAVRAEFVRFTDVIAAATPLGERYDLAGLGSYSRLLRDTREVVNMALADHITANFDL